MTVFWKTLLSCLIGWLWYHAWWLLKPLVRVRFTIRNICTHTHTHTTHIVVVGVTTHVPRPIVIWHLSHSLSLSFSNGNLFLHVYAYRPSSELLLAFLILVVIGMEFNYIWFYIIIVWCFFLIVFGPTFVAVSRRYFEDLSIDIVIIYVSYSQILVFEIQLYLVSIDILF